MHSFDGGPLLPHRQNIIHVIKWSRPSLLHFCIPQVTKNGMVGRPGNKASIWIQTFYQA